MIGHVVVAVDVDDHIIMVRSDHVREKVQVIALVGADAKCGAASRATSAQVHRCRESARTGS